MSVFGGIKFSKILTLQVSGWMKGGFIEGKEDSRQKWWISSANPGGRLFFLIMIISLTNGRRYHPGGEKI